MENILFFEAILAYKKSFNVDTFVNEVNQSLMAAHIMRVFFTKGSVNELNISQSLIASVKADFERNGPSESLFDTVWCNIQSDQMKATFMRFNKTDGFYDMIAAMLNEEHTENSSATPIPFPQRKQR